MKNCFTKCCFDYEVVGFHSECDIQGCKGNYDPAFTVYYQKVNDEYCYCLNRKQLGQYWRCVVENTNFLCPSRCERCKACKEMPHVFSKLQDSYIFFIQELSIQILLNISLINRCYGVFLIDQVIRNNLSESIPNIGLVQDYGQICSSKIYYLYDSKLQFKSKKS